MILKKEAIIYQFLTNMPHLKRLIQLLLFYSLGINNGKKIASTTIGKLVIIAALEVYITFKLKWMPPITQEYKIKGIPKHKSND